MTKQGGVSRIEEVNEAIRGGMKIRHALKKFGVSSQTYYSKVSPEERAKVYCKPVPVSDFVNKHYALPLSVAKEFSELVKAEKTTESQYVKKLIVESITLKRNK